MKEYRIGWLDVAVLCAALALLCVVSAATAARDQNLNERLKQLEAQHNVAPVAPPTVLGLDATLPERKR